MTQEEWLSRMARLVGASPIDLDEPRDDRGSFAAGARPPAAALWHRAAEEGARLGVRVARPLTDPAAVARRLAAAAVERGVEPVILSALPLSGFEPFGFRVERLPAAEGPARDAVEAELARFWNLALIVDAADVGGLH